MKPLHPIVVHFPIALLPVSVVADLAGFFSGLTALRDTGWWTMLGAAAGALVAVTAGLYDMRRANLDKAVHERVHRHMRVGLALLAAIIGLTVWRAFFQADGKPVSIWYLDLGALTIALTIFQGWLGGELVYGDGVFVKQSEQASSPGERPGAKHQGH